VQWKDCKGVDATLQRDALLCDVVACGVVEGFDPGMSLEAAQARHGPPTGQWTDPLYGVPAYYYEVPLGRVSLCLAPDSGKGHWVTIGYPQRSACRDVVRHADLLAQMLEIKGGDDEIYFSVKAGDGGPGGISLHVQGVTCESFQVNGTEQWDRPNAAHVNGDGRGAGE
jgi:hypothetical protein